MSERVCEGRIGQINENNSSSSKVEGLEMSCPDGSEIRIEGDKSSAIPRARRILRNKGYNADLVDETHGD